MSWFFEKIEIQAGMRKVQKRTLSFLSTNCWYAKRLKFI